MLTPNRNIYPENHEYVNQVFEYALQQIGKFTDSADLHSPDCQKSLLALLSAPTTIYKSLYTTLALPNYVPLLQAQSYKIRRAIAGEMARAFLRKETPIRTPEQLSGVLEVVKVIIKEDAQQPAGYPAGATRRLVSYETDEAIEEQGWLARLVHLLRSKDANVQFKVRLMLYECNMANMYRCYK